MPKTRLNYYIPKEIEQDIRDMADKLGMGYSDICTLILRAGFMSLKLSQDPMWKDYFETQTGSKNVSTN